MQVVFNLNVDWATRPLDSATSPLRQGYVRIGRRRFHGRVGVDARPRGLSRSDIAPLLSPGLHVLTSSIHRLRAELRITCYFGSPIE